MGCKLEIKKILMLLLVIVILLFASFAPVSKIVFAATTDTVQITFDPIGNVSCEVGPSQYAFGSIWGNSYQQTTSTYFTIWNNGTIDGMVVDAKVTTNAANLALAETATGTQTDNTYSIRVRKGTVSNSTYFSQHYWAVVDSAVTTTENFGMLVTVSNITSNWSSQTVVITFRGAAPS